KYGFWDNATDDEGNVIKKYKKIVLRNGGNCAFTTKFSDSYWQSLLEDLDCDNQSSRPCVVYLNGEYWGVYILQDDFNGAYMENKHGVNKDNVVIYKGDAEAIQPLGYKLDEGELPEGVTQENYYLQDLENFMRTHSSVSTQEDYDQLAAMVDEDSIIDYFATEVWINNKWDWPGKNWSIWKSTQTDDQNTYADGKWRFLIYDVEFGGVSGSSDVWGNALEKSNLLETGTDDEESVNSDKPHVRCFALMMTNRAFRDKFVAKLKSFSSGMFEYDRLMNRADLYKGVYQPILPQFFDRFPTGATVEDAIYGNYASWKTIVDFAEKRAEKIPDIVQYVRNYYGDKEEEPSQTETPASAAPSQSTMPSETGVPSQSEAPVSSNVPPASQTPLQSSVPAPTTAASPSPDAQVPGDQPATQAPSKMQGEKTEKLKDGTVKISKTGQNGKVISTEYRKAGISYRVKKNQTLSCGTADPKLLKKQRSLVIKDTIRLDGKNWKITEIRTNGFKGLNKLERVTVGSNITKIGNGAFQKCGRLKKIMIKGKKLSFLGKNAIKGIHKKAVIHCPKTKKKAYGKILSKKTGFDKKTMKLK
ncbi:MAG: CotH kinase family protein, partial [Lachnospiraceae bacterium]|nr:CotH kinase family protein [Lachnospiraceae bacterium]